MGIKNQIKSFFSNNSKLLFLNNLINEYCNKDIKNILHSNEIFLCIGYCNHEDIVINNKLIRRIVVHMPYNNEMKKNTLIIEEYELNKKKETENFDFIDQVNNTLNEKIMEICGKLYKTYDFEIDDILIKIKKNNYEELELKYMCNICYDNKCDIFLPCLHTLCSKCYKSILKHNKCCPFCRFNLGETEYIYY